MFRKLLTLLAIVCVLIALAFWSPWLDWNLSWINIFGIESKQEFSGLKVKSLSGELEVFVDEDFVGSTLDSEGFLEIFPITPGLHTIKLRRLDDTGFFFEVEKELSFIKDVDVIMGYEIGPSEVFSEGHILYSKKSYISESNPLLEIVSFPDDVEVTFDGEKIGRTPIKNHPIDLSSKHKILFTKKGYDPLEIEILPDSQEDRDKLQDLTLVLEINLFAKPVKLITD